MMPRRHGKVTRFVLQTLYLRDAYSAADLTTKERKAVREIQRKLLSMTTTLAAIKAAKADKVTEVSLDAL